jgi:hypothetical protein
MRRFIEWAKRDFNWSWAEAIVFILIISHFIFFTDYQYLPEKLDASYYLLSAIGQALAAIFAVVLTISLLITQITLKYTNRSLTNTFSRFVIIYLILFVIAILYPFLALNRTFIQFDVQISLFLATVCISLLVPYFLTFPNLQGIRRIINDLAKKTTEGYYHLEKDPIKEVMELVNIASSAFSNKDYFTADLVYQSLNSAFHRDIHQKLINASSLSFVLMHNTLYYIYDTETSASKITPIIEILKIVTIRAIYQETIVHGQSFSLPDESAVSFNLLTINEIGSELARQRQEVLVQKIISVLLEILPAALFKKSTYSISYILLTAMYIVKESMQRDLIQTINSILYRLIQAFAQGKSSKLLDSGCEDFFYDTLFQIETKHIVAYKSINSQFDTARRFVQMAKSRAEISEVEDQYKKWVESKQNIS